MKKGVIFTVLFVLFAIELAVCIISINRVSQVKQDTIKVNEVVKLIEKNYNDESKYSKDLEYTLIDTNETVLFKTTKSKSESINDAIQNNDIILDVVVDGNIVGKVLIQNNTNKQLNYAKTYIIIVIGIMSFVQLMILLYYFYHMDKNLVKPFNDLNEFAVRVAQGNLDMPLYMDKKHVFGSFTESFDLMRTELKKARVAEKKANDEKKEIVAKLSHDIKTPVASIKSTSEVGYELATTDKEKNYFNLINVKADQIKVLVDNLFNSSINEITEIDVNPSNYNSSILKQLIKNADYLNRTKEIEVPDCTIYIDKMRMQQTFDNVINNSYKYANTNIDINIELIEDYLKVSIRDYGKGVDELDLPLLKEKYKRGSNVTDEDGAGLGLHLANYFMENMNGKLELANDEPGFKVILYIRLI